MKKYVPVLKRAQLFAGVGDDEITSMLSCLDARLHTYKKGEYVLRQGEHLNDIIILVSGNLHIRNDDYWGNRSISVILTLAKCLGRRTLLPKAAHY